MSQPQPTRSLLVVVFTGCLLLSVARAAMCEENWPRFRGTDGTGVIDGGERLPVEWSATDHVKWKAEIPGRGWSSPVVWNGRIFLTSAVSSDEEEESKKGLYFGGERREQPEGEFAWNVICLDLDNGNVIWTQTAHRGKAPFGIHIKNSHATETPVTDGERIYCYFGNIGLFCYDLEGTLIWTRQFPPVATRYSWGLAASPVLHEGRLYIVNDNEEQSYLLALDAKTGDDVWRIEREEKSNWSTPFVWQTPNRTELVVPGSDRNRAYDLDGQLLYEFGGSSSITIATPYAAQGLLYVSSGYVLDRKKPIFAIRPGATGDISLEDDQTSNSSIAWCQKQAGPYNPSTIVYRDRLYVLLDRGLFACYDATTGQEIYSPQRLPAGRAFTSSPWAYQDRIFCLNEYGQTYVIAAGDSFKIERVNHLADDDMSMATPAIVNESLLLRTAGRLYCITNP
ncbi:MAG: PQQ-binding-like beta-propeller repeat protein [Pirellulaceae bacterium]|nr:PQQ-like beta-propeller repeat protein [Planctomycetales bacterium]